MTREEQNQAQALDLEARRREAEGVFEMLYKDWGISVQENAWAIVAREMGIMRFYQQLKGETWHS